MLGVSLVLLFSLLGHVFIHLGARINMLKRRHCVTGFTKSVPTIGAPPVTVLVTNLPITLSAVAIKLYLFYWHLLFFNNLHLTNFRVVFFIFIFFHHPPFFVRQFLKPFHHFCASSLFRATKLMHS